jgi:hypothetical protein
MVRPLINRRHRRENGGEDDDLAKEKEGSAGHSLSWTARQAIQMEFGATRLLNFFPARSGLNEFDTFSGPDDGDHGAGFSCGFRHESHFRIPASFCLGYGFLCVFHSYSLFDQSHVYCCYN